MSRPPNSKRTYDATRRRERAGEERLDTQRRVLDAAKHLFVAKGYTLTTMVDIAREAEVAVQSVYNAAKSKAELLQRVVDVVVAGDDDEILMKDRSSFTAVGRESDPERQVAMIAALITSIQVRSAPVQVAYRQAAAVDVAVAANLDAELHRRRETFGAVIAMLPEDRLRRSPEESADAAWAIGSTEVFQLLTTRRGWDADRFREWLTRTLIAQLLSPDTGGGQKSV